MKKILIFFLSFFIFSTSYGKQLKIFSCKNINDAESCSVACSPISGGAYEFLVNKTDKIVLLKTYIKGSYSTSQLFERCKIFDDSNWVCSDTSSNLIHFIQKMVDGIYVDAIYHPTSRDYGLMTCAK
jgi:hypothetical protein